MLQSLRVLGNYGRNFQRYTLKISFKSIADYLKP